MSLGSYHPKGSNAPANHVCRTAETHNRSCPVGVAIRIFYVCGYDAKNEIEKDYPRVKFAEEGPQVIKREFVEKLEYAKFSPRFSPFHSTLVASWVISLMDGLLKSVCVEPLVPIDE
ncbi:hypothetical protein B0H13DRAFT_2319366 [Mycena leptocephala]|nr:hypothetical protein B0H13DRAFT_2319366 [Mycena leptocephala]